MLGKLRELREQRGPLVRPLPLRSKRNDLHSLMLEKCCCRVVHGPLADQLHHDFLHLSLALKTQKQPALRDEVLVQPESKVPRSVVLTLVEKLPRYVKSDAIVCFYLLA